MDKKYQYILFDLDGTLTEPKPGITASELDGTRGKKEEACWDE